MNIPPICVMHHKSRDASATVSRMSAEGLPFQLFTDTSDYVYNRSTRRMGVALNYLRILDHPIDNEWRIITHDDIVWGEGAFQKIAYILQYAPPNVISFFNPNNTAYRECLNSGKRILSTYANFWPPCHAVHRSIAERMVIFFAANKRHVTRHAEDGLIQRWHSYHNVPIYVTVPGIIQHNLEVPSVFGTKPVVFGVERKSATYDPGVNVYAIDWQKEFADPFLNPVKKHFRD